MTTLSELFQQGTAHAWLFIPSAILLGALHGLEPGHSKTMMAAFIIAIRGTVTQATLLGLSATLSHTLVVWAVALIGLRLGRDWNSESTEPYFQVLSAVLIIAIALWMIWRTWRGERRAKVEGHDHDHAHPHDQAHDYDVAFTEPDHEHGHDHTHEELQGLDVSSGAYQDAHELAHANDIRRRFADSNVTTGQIVMFGLTGGLIPCPAAITVLLLCLQLKQFTLGVALVLCFSVGLAITMVTAGVAAALSVRHISRRWSGFGALAQRAPYLSGALIIGVGLYVGLQGMIALIAAGAM